MAIFLSGDPEWFEKGANINTCRAEDGELEVADVVNLFSETIGSILHLQIKMVNDTGIL